MQQSRRNLIIGLVCAGGPALAQAQKKHAKSSSLEKEQTAWGIDGDAKAVNRIIPVGMSDDMRFTPDRMEIKQGEIIRFTMKNNGNLRHEFVLGTTKVLDEHAALMKKFPKMEHGAPYMVHVPPGKTGGMVWNFNRAGNFDFACLIQGHYDAGMVGKITVTA